MADDAVASRAPEHRQAGVSYWVWLLLAFGVATAGALFLLWRRIRDRRARTQAVAPDPVSPEPPEPDVPRPAMADAAAPVATRDAAPEPLSIAIEPRRIGVAANEAMVEFVLTVTNPGGVVAEDVTVAAWLRSAHADQDREIAALIEAEPAPWLARSTIAAGGARRIESRLTLPRRRINVLTARGRPYFVPMIVVDVRYRMAGAGRVAAVAMAGIRRPDSDKLGPVFLDRGARSHDDVEARPHPVAATTRS